MAGRKISRCQNRTSVVKEGRVWSPTTGLPPCAVEQLAVSVLTLSSPFLLFPVKVTPLVGRPILLVHQRKGNKNLKKPPMTCGQIFISESYQEQVDVHLCVLEPVSPQRMEA